MSLVFLSIFLLFNRSVLYYFLKTLSKFLYYFFLKKRQTSLNTNDFCGFFSFSKDERCVDMKKVASTYNLYFMNFEVSVT